MSGLIDGNASRAAALEEKRQTIRSAWLRSSGGRVPFFVEAGESVRATRVLLDDPARDLALQESLLDAAAGIGDDTLPSLKPNLGIGVMATAFGCPHVLDEATDPWVKPVITDANPEAALSVAVPDPLSDGLLPLALERVRFFREHGRYPLRCVNLASPLLTASLVWEYGSFLAALLEHPREVHALLERITEGTLAFLRAERKAIGDLFGWTHESVWIPPEAALRLSDDVAAVLPADLYREFGVRYNNAFAGEAGGLVIHSCGDVTRSLRGDAGDRAPRRHRHRGAAERPRGGPSGPRRDARRCACGISTGTSRSAAGCRCGTTACGSSSASASAARSSGRTPRPSRRRRSSPGPCGRPSADGPPALPRAERSGSDRESGSAEELAAEGRVRVLRRLQHPAGPVDEPSRHAPQVFDHRGVQHGLRRLGRAGKVTPHEQDPRPS